MIQKTLSDIDRVKVYETYAIPIYLNDLTIVDVIFVYCYNFCTSAARK